MRYIDNKKFWKTMGVAAAAAGATAWMIAPGRAEEEVKEAFRGTNIAHRGLHRADESIPENSLTAFRAAAERGYGIELDVRMTADGEVVVFHDVTLQRLCGVAARVEDLTWEQLRTLRLAGSEERIPLLQEVLNLLRGRAPLVVELKFSRHFRQLCQAVRELLETYPGDYCVQSFDPLTIRWWRKHAPEVLRGQLSQPARRMRPETGEPCAFVLSRLLTNFLSRPQFISYSLEGRKPLTVRICEKMGAMTAAWTSHCREDAIGNDIVIFEYYCPEQKA